MLCFLLKYICIFCILFCKISNSLPIQNDTLLSESFVSSSTELSLTTSPIKPSNNQSVINKTDISGGAVLTSSFPTILYDQRQEGKYNVRADLENIQLLVIPSTPTASESLFDLLMKSSLKRQNQKLTKRKKLRLQNKTQAQQLSGESNENIYSIPSQQKQDNSFIEGRTPYHVDISSTQVLPSLDNKIVRRGINVPELSSEHNPVFSIMDNYHRNGKAIVDSNLNSAISNSVAHHDSDAYRFKSNNNEWEDRDVNNDAEKSFDNLNTDNIDRLASDGGGGRDGINGNSEDGWELTLLGAHEQCGPDRVRDSYGVCQFISSDFK